MEEGNTGGRNEGTPLVSIVLLAYNHLAITKICVEGLYKNTDEALYELITVNNGSDDGTEEYFKGLSNQKKISFSKNVGVDVAINCGIKMAEGKYTLNLSNDIVPTKNWLTNLIACMESDERIGMVSPVCNASSNRQQIRLKYSSLAEVQTFAAMFNRSNPDKWEERLKLVTYSCLFRTSVLKTIGGFDEEFNPGAYDDDAISFRIRREGYKLILAGDTFVYHFGSVTFNAEYSKNGLAARNRALFYRKYGVHSWSASFIDNHVLALFDYRKSDGINILGIGESCGSTLLQIKNLLRRSGRYDVQLFYLSENPACMRDLKTICTACKSLEGEPFSRYLEDVLFDCVIVESDSKKIDIKAVFGQLGYLLREDGQIICTAADNQILETIRSIMKENGLHEDKSRKDYYFSFIKSHPKKSTDFLGNP